VRTQTLVRPRRLVDPRRPAGLLSAALSLAVILSSGTAFADSRDDLKAAYNKALGQYNNLELDPALAALDQALAGTSADDPATAPLRMLRAVIIFSNSGNKNETTAAFVDAVKADYNVALPTELRSPDLQKLLDKARKDSGASAPSESVRHTSPSTDGCGQDLQFEVLTSGIPDGGQVGLYWRNVGDSGDFKSVTMDAFGNIATAQVLASEHGDKPVEYFVYVYDGANKALGNKGAQDNPLVADVKCVKEVPKEKEPEKPPPPKHSLPKIFINLGLGTGIGVELVAVLVGADAVARLEDAADGSDQDDAQDKFENAHVHAPTPCSAGLIRPAGSSGPGARRGGGGRRPAPHPTTGARRPRPELRKLPA
jgi:hypothetical protein